MKKEKFIRGMVDGYCSTNATFSHNSGVFIYLPFWLGMTGQAYCTTEKSCGIGNFYILFYLIFFLSVFKRCK